MTIIKDKIDSSAFLEAGSLHSRMAAGAMSVTVDKDGGAFINGPLSISSGIGSIKFGPIFKFNPLAASCVPSTLVTPISTFIFDIPAKHAASYASIAAMVLSTV